MSVRSLALALLVLPSLAQAVVYVGNPTGVVMTDDGADVVLPVKGKLLYADAEVAEVHLQSCDAAQQVAVMPIHATVDFVEGFALTLPKGQWCAAKLVLDETLAVTAVADDDTLWDAEVELDGLELADGLPLPTEFVVTVAPTL